MVYECHNIKVIGIMVNCGSLKSVVIVYGIALAREVFICTKGIVKKVSEMFFRFS